MAILQCDNAFVIIEVLCLSRRIAAARIVGGTHESLVPKGRKGSFPTDSEEESDDFELQPRESRLFEAVLKAMDHLTSI